MKYTVRKSLVWIVGRIWMPAIVCSQVLTLSNYDVENIRAHGDGNITRDAVEQWLMSHSGDFQSVLDFAASIEDGGRTIDIDWATEDGETLYNDTLSSED